MTTPTPPPPPCETPQCLFLAKPGTKLCAIHTWNWKAQPHKVSETLDALTTLKDACAAACRVIHEAGLTERFALELHRADIADGFGVRAQRALAELERAEARKATT